MVDNQRLIDLRDDPPTAWDIVSDNDITFGAGSLLITFAGPPCDVRFEYTQGRTRKRHMMAIGAEHNIMASPQRIRAAFNGKRNHSLIDEGDLSCILAFVDAALKSAVDKVPSIEVVCYQAVPDDALRHREQLGHWLALQALKETVDNALLHHLRRQESYGLASYLLKNPGGGAHLNELCVEYGLSYSHFRRLCRRSLGHSIKTRLRGWRAARTVLDIIDSKQPILDIAVENGYTSASHVSSDLKQIFGFTPRTARNARRLLP